MKWYQYLACFFAGFFVANVIPHLVHGMSGDRFPSPFATPPGKGLSSPLVNVVWGLANLLIGYLLVRAGRVASGNKVALLLLFLGFAACSIMLSLSFVDKMH